MSSKLKIIALMLFPLAVVGCNKDSSTTTTTSEDTSGTSSDSIASACDTTGQTCITVGVYLLDSNGYTDTGKELYYTVGAECESWTRTAPAHDEYESEHDHYNAHKGSTYVDGVFTWYEYGPEHDQDAIDATCSNGVNGVDGVQKEVDAVNYSQHQNFYLKIESVTP